MVETLEQLVWVGVGASDRGNRAHGISRRSDFDVIARRHIESVGDADEGGDMAVLLLLGGKDLSAEVAKPANRCGRVEDDDVPVTIESGDRRHRVPATHRSGEMDVDLT